MESDRSNRWRGTIGSGDGLRIQTPKGSIPLSSTLPGYHPDS